MQAVHEMHMSGFCHADLKSSNAMVTHSEGNVTVRLIDMACSQQQKPGMQIVSPAQHWQYMLGTEKGMKHASLVSKLRQALHEAALPALQRWHCCTWLCGLHSRLILTVEVCAVLQVRSPSLST